MGSEVGLYYMRARWYEQRTGRFLSEDPLGLEGGINQYVFGGDDPINRGDPTGRDWCEPNWWQDIWECVDGDGVPYDCQMEDDPNACPGLSGSGEPPRGGVRAARARAGVVGGPWQVEPFYKFHHPGDRLLGTPFNRNGQCRQSLPKFKLDGQNSRGQRYVLEIELTATQVVYPDAYSAWYAGTIIGRPWFRLFWAGPTYGGAASGYVICETGEAFFDVQTGN